MTLKAGIHSIPLADYLADPCEKPSLSSSVAHVLLEQSPLHARAIHPRLNEHYEPEQNGKFDLGSAGHNRLLEDGKRIVVIEADNYKKKDAQVEREAARKDGKIPVLSSQTQAIDDMVGIAQEAISKSELADIFKPHGGDSEQTIIWQDGGVWCRTRPDRMSTDKRILVDFKTTGASAEPETWAKRQMVDNGCDLQAALGLRGIQSVTGIVATFIFITQETFPPYAVSFIGFGPQYQHYADVRIQRSIDLWGVCLKRNRWPGYPSRTVWVAPAPWLCQQWDEQVERLDHAS